MAFVLDRAKFLDTVTDAVTYETNDPAAERMIALLENQTFLLTIPALLCDKDLKVRNKAYLALGNLIASDNRKISQMAFGVAVKGFKYVERGFTESETFAGAAYVLHNIGVRIRDWKELGQDHIKSLVVDTACAKLRAGDCTNAAICDLLHTVHMIGKATDVPTDVLLRLVSKKAKGVYRTALKMLGEQISEEDFKLTHARSAYDCYRDLLINGRLNVDTLREVLWGFSNIVVEEGIADHFLADHDAREEIISVATLDNTYNIEAEATWVLLNAVSKADMTVPPLDVLQGIADSVQTFLANYDADNCQIYAAAQETLENIRAEYNRRCPPFEPETESETDEDAMEIDEDDDVLPPTAEEDYEALWREITQSWECDVCPPCELPSLTPVRLADYSPPSAIQILEMRRNYGTTSMTVNNLINSVVDNQGAFTPLPDNVALTKADLAAIDARGFTIVRGNIGINPLLSTAVYSF